MKTIKLENISVYGVDTFFPSWIKSMSNEEIKFLKEKKLENFEQLEKMIVAGEKVPIYFIKLYELVKKYFPFAKEKTKLIPNGYNSDVFYPETINKEQFLNQFGITKNYKNIVSFAGKFTYFKGIDILLKAAKTYEDEDTLTLLAGDGELFDEMNKLAKELNLKNVVFLKNQPHDILRKLYSIANVSLIPSRNEAFGLVVIEALACGAPVIGTNSGGIPDIITKEVGMLIEEENYEELASKIKDILNQKVKFDRNTCANYAKEKYSQDNFTSILVDIYENGIKNNKIKE